MSPARHDAAPDKLGRVDVPELVNRLRRLLAQLSRDDMVAAEEEGVPDGNFEGIRSQIREFSDGNHRKLQQILEQSGDKWTRDVEGRDVSDTAEDLDSKRIKSLKDWSPMKTKSRFAGRAPSIKPRKPVRRDPVLDRRIAEKLGRVVMYLLSNSTDLVGSGMGLLPQEMGAFSTVVVHALYSRYTQDSSDLMTVLREASILHVDKFGINDVMGGAPMSLSFDSSDVPTGDSFLGHLLRGICGREEVLAFADSIVRLAKGPQNPQSASDHGDKAFSTVSHLVQVLTGIGAPTMPTTLASVCHVLYDHKTRITPRHVLLYYVFLPALTRAMTGDWQRGVRPGSATDFEGARSEVTRIYAMFLHTAMLATPVPSLPLKQRASLASLQILMGTYFQRLLTAPRRWAIQGLPELFPGSFCSPWSKPVDLCSAVILTGAEALTLCDAFQQYIGTNRQASDAVPEATYASVVEICDRTLELDTRRSYLVGTESPASTLAADVAPDSMQGSSVERGSAVTSAAVARCQIILRSAHDQLRAATAAESAGAGAASVGDTLSDSLSDILGQVEQNFVMLESFVAESHRLQAAFALVKAYSQELQLHGQLTERSLADDQASETSQHNAFFDNASGQLADMLHGETEHEARMEFTSAFDGTEEGDGAQEGDQEEVGAGGAPFSPTSPLATLMSTVFSPMNIS